MRAIRTTVEVVSAGTAIAFALANVEPSLKRDADLMMSGAEQIVHASGDAARLIAVAMPTDLLGLSICIACPLGLLGLVTLLMLPKLWEVLSFYWAMHTVRDAARAVVRDIRER